MKVIHLLADIGDCAAKTQTRLLSPLLNAEIIDVAGIGLRALRRRLLADPPDILHAWRLPAIRTALGLKLATRGYSKLIATESTRGGRLTGLDQTLLQLCDRVMDLPLAVRALPPVPLPISLPEGSQRVIALGPWKRSHGGREAIWATDILKFAAKDVHLAMIGDGPELGKLQQFADDLGRAREHTHFLPRTDQAAAMLARADAVIVPGRLGAGRQVVLEAMAAGVPVVASRVAGLTDLIEDGVSGLLVPAGNPPEFARALKRVLDDQELARSLTQAGRQAVASRSPESIATQWQQVYRTVLKP